MTRKPDIYRVTEFGVDVSRDLTPEQKITRRKAMRKIQEDAIEKEWRLSNTNGPPSTPEQHYPKVFFAKPNKED